MGFLWCSWNGWNRKSRKGFAMECRKAAMGQEGLNATTYIDTSKKAHKLLPQIEFYFQI